MTTQHTEQSERAELIRKIEQKLSASLVTNKVQVEVMELVALLSSDAGPVVDGGRAIWKARYYGSSGLRGYNIYAFKNDVATHGEFVTNLGENGTAADALCAAHNSLVDALSSDAKPVREWVGLTDEEIHDAYDEVARREPYSMAVTRRNIARAIESKLREKNAALLAGDKPVDMVLYCPKCGKQHIDAPDLDHDPHYEGALIWENPPHKSHLCHGCGHIWRPSDTPTNGVARTASGKDADTSPLLAEDKAGGEPDWRHPKIQALIGADARNRIVINLIWQLIEDPECELTASDMEYWDDIHDALKAKLTHPSRKSPGTEYWLVIATTEHGAACIGFDAQGRPVSTATYLRGAMRERPLIGRVDLNSLQLNVEKA